MSWLGDEFNAGIKRVSKIFSEPNKAPLNRGPGPSQEERDAAGERQRREEEAYKQGQSGLSYRQQIANRLLNQQQGGYDQNLADSYYGQQDAGIQKAFDASNQASAGAYARRGLGASGMNTAGQQSNAVQQAILQRTARMNAITQATGVRQQDNAGERAALLGASGISQGNSAYSTGVMNSLYGRDDAAETKRQYEEALARGDDAAARAIEEKYKERIIAASTSAVSAGTGVFSGIK